jgi:hypothetical protein
VQVTCIKSGAGGVEGNLCRIVFRLDAGDVDKSKKDLLLKLSSKYGVGAKIYRIKSVLLQVELKCA